MEDIEEQVNKTDIPEDETDRLHEENLVLTRQLTERDEQIAQLEETLAGRETEIAALRETGETAERESVQLSESLAGAVTAYRDAVLKTSPELPDDLVTGTTVAEIDASAEQARDLVAQVRQEVEAENVRQRVPAGAPPRTVPDVSGLSAREKIRFALTSPSS
jgi:hypothetical protein